MLLQQPASLLSPSSSVAPIITSFSLGEVDRFRESVGNILLGAPNVIHLAFWHVQLMVLRLTSSAQPHELLQPATSIAKTLNSSYTIVTPLNHHFAALAAVTLGELRAYDEMRLGAEQGIEDLFTALVSKRGLMSREDSAGWDSVIRDLVTKNRSQRGKQAPSGESADRDTAGLQHLADAAISGNNNAASGRPTTPKTPGQSSGAASATSPVRSGQHQENGSTYDPTVKMRSGYLSALVQDV